MNTFKDFRRDDQFEGTVKTIGYLVWLRWILFPIVMPWIAVIFWIIALYLPMYLRTQHIQQKGVNLGDALAENHFTTIALYETKIVNDAEVMAGGPYYFKTVADANKWMRDHNHRPAGEKWTVSDFGCKDDEISTVVLFDYNGKTYEFGGPFGNGSMPQVIKNPNIIQDPRQFKDFLVDSHKR